MIKVLTFLITVLFLSNTCLVWAQEDAGTRSVTSISESTTEDTPKTEANTDSATVREKIHVKFENPNGNEYVIIEEDDYSIWSYVMDTETDTIIFSGFICAIQPPVADTTDLIHFMEEGIAPPLLESYANEYSIVLDAHAEDFQVLWSEDAADIFMGPVFYARLNVKHKLHFVVSIAEDGIYGYSLERPQLGFD